MSNLKFLLAAGFNYPGASLEKADNWIRPAPGFCQASVSKGQKHNRHKILQVVVEMMKHGI